MASPIGDIEFAGLFPASEKLDVIEAYGTTSSYGSSNVPKKLQSPRKWRTSLVRFGPLSGIFAMCLAIMSLVASCGILAGSNGAPTRPWHTPPSTYLAIFTAISNLSMRYAAIQGVLIAWWTKAMNGNSLRSLHHDWYVSEGFKGLSA